MVWMTQRIADIEIGLMYRDRTFARVLGPGVHRILPGRGTVEVRRLDLRQMPVKDTALSALMLTHRAVVDEHFVVADMADHQVGAVFADGKLVDLVGPGGVAFYARRLRAITLEVFDAAAAIDVPATLVAPVSWLGAGSLVLSAEVPSDHVGLLYVDGVLDRQLAPGRYAFFKAVRQVAFALLDRRLQTLEVTGQEVLTKDRIGLRANVTAVYRIDDPGRVVSVTSNLRDYLYKVVQF